MQKQKTIPSFIENDDRNFRTNPVYADKKKMGKKVATSVDALNPEIHRVEASAEARALAEIYERRSRHLDELVRNGGQVVHMYIPQEERKPQMVHMEVV